MNVFSGAAAGASNRICMGIRGMQNTAAVRSRKLRAVKGSRTAKKLPAGMENRPYRKRFCGFPTGVAMLPKFAATVWSTTIQAIYFFSPIISRMRIVKGTKVRRATSLVISMEQKKGSITSIQESCRKLFSPESSFLAIRTKRPHS